MNLSGIYERDSIYNKAEDYAIQAINIYKLRSDKVSQASSLNNLGNIYLSQNKFNKAKKTYLEGINLIKNDNSSNSVRFKANLYYNLAWAMRNLKDYKAYDYQELSYEIEDNQREKEIRKIIEEVTAKHKINIVNAERQLIETKKSKATLLLSILSLFIIILLAGIIYNYKLRQRNLKLKLSKNSLLQQQSIEKIKSESQTKILNATIDGKESERKEIAEILHDDVSTLLSSANMHLSATKKKFDNNTPIEIEKTQAIILEASQKIRDLSHNLISSVLLKFGLEYAIKDLEKKYSNSELTFEVISQNKTRYNQDFEIKIFNIIQELSNNILKHSYANNAQIKIKEENDNLIVLVNDDGIGFSASSSNKNEGIGINQIKARIEMMNGEIAINSEKNKGTRILITIPLKNQLNS